METMNPIALALALALAKGREPTLVQPEPEQTRLAEKRSSLRQAGSGKLSGTAATLPRLLFPPPLRLATAPHIASSRFGFRWSCRCSHLRQEQRPAAATEIGSQFEAGSSLG
jgi:hypothetical protein